MASPPYNPSSVGSSGSPSEAGSATPRSDASGSTSRTRTPKAEAMAIVGIGCRWPGANSLPEFSELLMNGKSALRDVPKEVFNAEAFYHPRRERPGSFNTTKGHYLKNDRREFDPAFFGISPKEAETMDPQQRQLLEVAYESLESAGVTLDDVSASKTGCFVGNFSWEFSLNRFSDPDFSLTTPYGPTGATSTLLSNRISYLFNLKGPSLTMDTACSSSMYALNAACKSLQYGECTSALVCGVNLILGVTNNMDAAKMGVLSPTGICHTFDAAADGYARSEGVACLYIKRLVDALQDGDNIRAIIRASAVNTNGKTPGITHPSATQQEAVIRDAYAQAGIADVGETGYFECHGTGTPVGDPLEVSAIASVFAESRTPEEPLLIGSVKTNIGHSEAASGLAGVIKAVLTLESGVIPPTIGVRELNPRIDFQGGKIEVAREKRRLRRGRVSVNSFGFGGANAHVILESVESFMQDLRKDALDHPVQWMLPPREEMPPTETQEAEEKEYLAVFSGHDEYSLDRNVAAIESVIDQHPLRDLAYTLGSRRTHFHHRATAILNNHTKSDFRSHLKTARKRLAPRLGLVFTGQGAQWAGMGRDLLLSYPETLKTLRELDRVLQSLPDAPRWTLEESFTRPLDAKTLEQPEFAQPMCTALQIILVRLLCSWGVEPRGCVGHSSGEIAAAYAAGYLSGEEAVVLAYYRGQAVRDVSEPGGMLAVGLGEGEVEEYTAELEGVRMACVNSPGSVTVSGTLGAVEELKKRLDEKGVFNRLLKTGGRAYHSHLMAAPGERYQRMCEAFFGNNTFTPTPSAKLVSSVTGEVTTAPLTPTYWRRNLESPVQFSQALTTLLASDTVDELIEIGPHTALKGPINQILQTLPTTPGYHGSLLRNQPAGRCMLDLASHLFLLGAPVSLYQANNLSQSPSPKFLPDLPRYRWNHTRLHAAENRLSVGYNHRKHKRHDILGSRVPYGGESVMMWRNLLRLSDVPWMGDHVVQGQVVFPATGYIAMAIEAATQLQEDAGNAKVAEYCLENISFKSAMVIEKDDDTGREIIFAFTPRVVTAVNASREWLDFVITSCPADTKKKEEWTEHCRGSVRVVLPPATLPAPSMPWLETLETAETRLVQHETIYEGMKQAGFSYGPTFSSVSDLRGNWEHRVATANSMLRPTEKMMQAESRYVVHPATLDTAMQVTIVILASGRPDQAQLNLPVFLEELVVRPNRGPLKAEDTARIAGRAGPMGVGMNEGCFSVSHPDSGLLVVGKGLHIKAAFDRSMRETKEKPKRAPYMRVVWKPEVSSITSEQFKAYLNDLSEDDELLMLTELAAHHNPAMNILHIGSSAEVERVVSHLGRQTDFPLYRSYTAVGVAVMRGVTVYEKVEDIPGDVNFDLIITSSDVDPATLTPKLGSKGSLIAPSSSTLSSPNVLQGDKYHLHRQTGAAPVVQHDVEKSIVMLHQAADKQHDRSFSDVLTTELTARGWEVSHTDLTVAEIPEASNVLSVVDLEGPSPLLEITDEELTALKRLAARSRDVLWLSARNSTDPVGSNHATAMTAGLGRSIMLEEPKIRFNLLELETPATSSSLNWVYNKLNSWYLPEREKVPDYEFEQRKGTVYISRLYPDEIENSRFERQIKPLSAREVTMEEIRDKALRMELEHVGQPDSVYFTLDPAAEQELKEDWVEIRTAAVGMNNKDLVMLQGLFSATTRSGETFFSNEHAGTVIRVGSAVTDLAPGDRVMAVGPGRYRTVERFPAYTCRKLLPTEDFSTVAGVGVVYVTAIYALNHLARLEEGETVLIHSGAGGVGIAAITLALSLGARVYTTVSSASRKQFLINKFGFPEQNILYSRDRSFATDIKRLTGGRGVDVILSAHTGDLFAATWSCLAPYGRFVDIGRRDALDHGRLDMSNFAGGASFHSFDLGILVFERPKLFGKLLDEMFSLLRSGTVKPVDPTTTVDISELSKAFRTFMKGAHMGKIVITYDNPSSKVPCKFEEPAVKFRADASYLILGGLGGLGKSLISWMAARGAQSFVLLSRSGASSDSSRAFIDSMAAKGVDILALKGDIRSREDLEMAKEAAPKPIRGVFHAAMVLHDGLFSLSKASEFREVVEVKHHGMINLHHAFSSVPLDFMLAMSSLSGILGTLSQSNYSAANCSLDSLSRLRHSLSLPCASVALGGVSEVGYIAEHQHIAAGLARNGFYPICEREFLLAVETGIRWQLERVPNPACTRDPSGGNLIVTGLEPIRLREMLAAGFDGASYITHDRRLSVIGNAISHSTSSSPSSTSSSTKEVKVREKLRTMDKDEAYKELQTVLKEKLARLMLVEADTINAEESLASYGLDSMIGGELRRWLYGEFGVDISFLELSGSGTSTARLGRRILRAIRTEEEAGEK